jgi:hypothetical protein
MVYINPDHVGKIVEFQDHALKLVIAKPGETNVDQKYILTVRPCNDAGVYLVYWNKTKYSVTSEQAKKHILDAIEIARISSYAPTHTIGIQVPFYPYLTLPATEITKALDVFKSAMDNYF